MKEECDFQEYRQLCAEKRRANLRNSTKILIENGVKFDSLNGGVHLVIQTKKGKINFYPSTGLFKGAAEGRGVFNLLKVLEVEK